MVRECGHEGRWVVVLSNRMPSRRRRSLRPLGLLLALVAASVAASAFVGTARADDPAPASGGAATNPPAVSPDPTTSLTDPSTATTESPPVVADTTEPAATNPPTPPPDRRQRLPTDPPTTSTDTSPTASTDTSPTASTDTSPTASTDTSPNTSTDTSSTATDSKTADIAPASSATTELPAASNDSPASFDHDPAERGCKHRGGLTAGHRPGTSDDRAVPHDRGEDASGRPEVLARRLSVQRSLRRGSSGEVAVRVCAGPLQFVATPRGVVDAAGLEVGRRPRPDRRRAAPTSSHPTTRAESSARRTNCSRRFLRVRQLRGLPQRRPPGSHGRPARLHVPSEHASGHAS